MAGRRLWGQSCARIKVLPEGWDYYTKRYYIVWKSTCMYSIVTHSRPTSIYSVAVYSAVPHSTYFFFLHFIVSIHVWSICMNSVHLEIVAFGPYFFFFTKIIYKNITSIKLIRVCWTKCGYSLPYFPLIFLWDTSLQTPKNDWKRNIKVITNQPKYSASFILPNIGMFWCQNMCRNCILMLVSTIFWDVWDPKTMSEKSLLITLSTQKQNVNLVKLSTR